jgi:hypothetical protein
MKIGSIGDIIANKVCLLVLAMSCLQLVAADSLAGRDKDLKFDVLRIGTQTFTNVTVGTRNADYVVLLHKGGVISFEVAKLPDDVRAKLGYKVASRARRAKVATWAKAAVTRMKSGAVTHLERRWRQRARSALANRAWVNPKTIALAIILALFVHLFFSHGARLICRKTGNEPGGLIWIPALQVIPLFRAAGMPPVWVLALLLPVVNLVVYVAWCVKIVRARSKSGWLAPLLVLPVANLFAFLYLAFSSGPEPKETVTPKLVTLQAV